LAEEDTQKDHLLVPLVLEVLVLPLVLAAVLVVGLEVAGEVSEEASVEVAVGLAVIEEEEVVVEEAEAFVEALAALAEEEGEEGVGVVSATNLMVSHQMVLRQVLGAEDVVDMVVASEEAVAVDASAMTDVVVGTATEDQAVPTTSRSVVEIDTANVIAMVGMEAAKAATTETHENVDMKGAATTTTHDSDAGTEPLRPATIYLRMVCQRLYPILSPCSSTFSSPRVSL
jgi:hypothetical protein